MPFPGTTRNPGSYLDQAQNHPLGGPPHPFYRIKGSNPYIMSAGLFDNEETFAFDHQVFIDEKPYVRWSRRKRQP